MTAPTATVAPAVLLDDVTVRLGRVQALNQVTVRVAAGERVALLGASGAGKSTLLGLLPAAVTPSRGSVTVLGQRPADLSRRQVRRLRGRMGWVQQQLHLAGPLRVVHNVNAGRLAQTSSTAAIWSLVRPGPAPDAIRALEAVGMGNRAFDRTDDLSGGERQRVALARVLLQDPELLLADEPVSSLDPTLAVEMLELLTSVVAGGRTVVASLHDPVLARRFFPRLIGLRSGSLAFDAPSTAVTDDMLAALYARSDR